ncbi:sigma-70 family RNA polymerase sigma factor [Streptomyces kaniharaensis]|uniref:Sigma-70 family RNA polymerase sigma factor n=1 Tax=Streptomyces kaniharaensis TaxID=212423 RepID=A0A6N7KZ23_9ACTN|nr:sigma factor-like helix-turn-helix DNA-binding protein [Streptomyces kaniharaensis]MQS16946.1 sigma-70 family RNA polymerase sigma factor [Streptomyces kaniharaensis]
MTIDRDAPAQTSGRGGGRTMNDGGGTAPDGARLRITFDAFCSTHERAWTAFARTQVGAHGDAAALVVRRTKDHLLHNWPLALRQEAPAAYAWRLLKEHLAAWLAAQSEAAVLQTAAMDAAIGRFCHRAGLRPQTLSEQLALLGAILDLPERQRDTVVLAYCLGLDDDQAAGYLGITPATLRSHRCQARRRIARATGRLDFATPGLRGGTEPDVETEPDTERRDDR